MGVKMPAIPYVGITGLTSAEESIQVLNIFNNEGFPTETYDIMVGALVNPKTLRFEKSSKKRYPLFEDVPEILGVVDGSFTTIHYGSDGKNLFEDASKILDFKKIYETNICKGLQLNIPWPDVNEIKRIKDDYPEIKLILPIDGNSINSKNDSELSGLLAPYSEYLNYVLIDPSGGKKISFDMNRSLGLCNEINREYPELTVGFAGGFDGLNVRSRLDTIAKNVVRKCCIDTEGGVRNDDDTLNFEKVSGYVSGARLGLS